MTKPKILMIGAYPDFDMVPLERDYDVIRLWEAADQKATLAKHAKDIRAIATRGDLGTSAELINALPALEIIACNGVGVDGIDFPAARTRNIKVTNTPDVLTDDVADLAIGLMISIARRMPEGDALVRTGTWPQAGMPLCTRMSGKRLGIVGLGRIGKAIATRAQAFGMPVSYYSRTDKKESGLKYFSSIPELASQSDFLLASLAGGPATKALISADALKALGPNGYFINVARGSVVDEDALLTALENNTIKGAALDVFLNEPAINPRFFKLPNVVLQPHVGSATLETRMAMGKLVQDNLAAYFAGRPLLTPVS